MEPVAVVSNHTDVTDMAGWFGVDFHHLPIVDDARSVQESQLETLLDELSVELVVLARYMQVLSPQFCARWANRCINIHHSFLPAFAGAMPYHQAHTRGVKVSRCHRPLRHRRPRCRAHHRPGRRRRDPP